MTGADAGDRIETVLQGEFRVSADPNVILSTVLGSCVAVCLHDPHNRIGGMNHFLLPGRETGDGVKIRFGAHAMELLINTLLKQGAARGNLVAKLFGGSAMSRNLADIGAANAAFACEFLSNEGIPVVSESLRGTSARRLKFWPVTGRAQQMLVPNDSAPDLPAAAPIAPPLPPVPEITLF